MKREPYPVTELDLHTFDEPSIVEALLRTGCVPSATLCAFAAARKPPRTIAYVAAEHVPPARADVREGRYLVDLVWADEPLRDGSWSEYRGLRLALAASGKAWMALASLADLSADHRVFVSGGALPAWPSIDSFWRNHQRRNAQSVLLIALVAGNQKQVWRIDGAEPARMLAGR